MRFLWLLAVLGCREGWRRDVQERVGEAIGAGPGSSRDGSGSPGDGAGTPAEGDDGSPDDGKRKGGSAPQGSAPEGGTPPDAGEEGPPSGSPPPASGRVGQIDGCTLIGLGKDGYGEERSAFIHRPKGATDKLPIIIVLHGGFDSDARSIAPNWKSYFDKGYVLVFPNGQRRVPDRGAWLFEEGNDHSNIDVIRKLIDAVAADFGGNKSSVYVTGYSAGAIFVYQLMCEAPALFKGFATVSHKLQETVRDQCDPAKAGAQFVYFMGTQDHNAGWAATPGRALSAEDTLQFFVNRYGCDRTKRTVTARTDSPADKTRVAQWDFNACDSGSHVRFFKIEGGGHAWPGGVLAGDGADVCRDINATQEIVGFWRETAGLP